MTLPHILQLTRTRKRILLSSRNSRLKSYDQSSRTRKRRRRRRSRSRRKRRRGYSKKSACLLGVIASGRERTLARRRRKQRKKPQRAVFMALSSAESATLPSRKSTTGLLRYSSKTRTLGRRYSARLAGQLKAVCPAS